MQDKFSGCLVGFNLGDAFGQPLENLEETEIRNKYGFLEEITEVDGSGITKILINMTNAVLADPLNPFPLLFNALEEEVLKKPQFYSHALFSVLKAYKLFGFLPGKIKNYLIKGLKESPDSCEILPVVIPAALIYMDDEIFRGVTENFAQIINPHTAVAYLGLFYGFFLKELLISKNRIKAYEEALKKADFYTIKEILAVARAFRERLYHLPYKNACDLQTKNFVADIVESAVYIFLAEDKPFDIIVKSANLGGGAASRTAAAGALAGAYWGQKSLPEQLLLKLNQLSLLIDLGSKLWVKKW